MAQQIRELMTPNPVALPGTASVHEAARAMRDAQREFSVTAVLGRGYVRWAHKR
jgi:CBS domain-containing protein